MTLKRSPSNLSINYWTLRLMIKFVPEAPIIFDVQVHRLKLGGKRTFVTLYFVHQAVPDALGFFNLWLFTISHPPYISLSSLNGSAGLKYLKAVLPKSRIKLPVLRKASRTCCCQLVMEHSQLTPLTTKPLLSWSASSTPTGSEKQAPVYYSLLTHHRTGLPLHLQHKRLHYQGHNVWDYICHFKTSTCLHPVAWSKLKTSRSLLQPYPAFQVFSIELTRVKMD